MTLVVGLLGAGGGVIVALVTYFGGRKVQRAIAGRTVAETDRTEAEAGGADATASKTQAEAWALLTGDRRTQMTNMRADLEQARTDNDTLRAENAELHTEVAELRAEVADLKRDLRRFLAGEDHDTDREDSRG